MTGKLYSLYPNYKEVYECSGVVLKNDSLYCINKEGVIYSSHVNLPVFKKLESTGIKDATCIYYNDNFFFIGSTKGIFKYNLKLKRSKIISEQACESFIKNEYNNQLYALGLKKLFMLKDSCVSLLFNIESYYHSEYCQRVTFTDTNNFYITTTNGLFEINEDYTDRYTKKSAMPSTYFIALYYHSAENCLFVGTGEKGLLKLQFKNCFSFASEFGFGEKSSLSSVIRTKSEDVLLLEPSGVIHKMKADTLVEYLTVKPYGASLAEIDEKLYIGSWSRGVIIVKDKKIIDSLRYPEKLPGKSVHACFKDSRGEIWIGTNNGVAKGKLDKNIKPFLTNLIKNTIITFFELKNGNICIGGSDGVYIIDKNNTLLVHLSTKEGLVGKEVRSFYEDKEGKLWIGSYGGGLYCYFNKKLTSINRMKNAQLNEDVFCLAKDEFGYLYITSNHGLWRLNEKDLSDFYKGRLSYLVPFHYEEESGILNTEFNGGFQNNFLKTKSSHFYFPTLQGILAVMPEKPIFRKLEPLIDEISVNDEAQHKEKRIFDRETFSVEFKFSSSTFLSKYNVFYQYKLDGQNSTQWSALEKNMSVTYKLIPPGTYTFSVRALDAFNDRNPKLCSYVFEVKPYFYETFYFKVGSFCSFILLTTAVGRYRVQRYRKKAEEKERVKRQVAELKLQAIQAQMNPHFIFNSLNSIKYYLSSNDQAKADKYIDHFSTLLRNFMENGSKSFITLYDEIQMLTSYLELEKQRMNPSFDFYVNIQDALYETEIPTNLIQPLVENAIKHGINHSLTKCKLVINFKRTDDVIICVIEDNGIGRKKSHEINKNRPDQHTSKGLEIVSEKIRVVKEIYNIHVKLSIDDALKTSKNGTGTCVTLHIPIKKNENTNH